MKKEEAINTFNQGMIMDINPIVTPNDSLCNALNATLVTFNGNENVLQCDMGNGRVETACLPPGYVPVGSTQLGGIIYIVSYNPIINKSQIGCFPSPERNITTDELQVPNNNLIISDLFEGNSSHIKSKLKKLILLDKEIHPGDKFQIGCNQLQYQENNFISAQEPGNTDPDKYPKYIKLNVVAIQDNGVINNLNNSLIWHDNNYYILGVNLQQSNGKLDLDEYRNLVQANYNVFDSKVDGKLAILAELECIDTFSVSWDAIKQDDKWNFYFYLNWTYNNQTSPDKINLYGIGIQANDSEISDKIITTYPKSTYGTSNDILSNKETIFYTPCYVNSVEDLEVYKKNNNIMSPRKNDGTDNQFLLMSPYQTNQTSGIISFNIYPKMPFGYLDWLKQSFSVDMDSLGSGKIELKEYRYYHNDGSIILNWGLDAYPERNKEIKSVEFQFHEYNQEVKNYISNNAQNIQDNYSVNGFWNQSTAADPFNLVTNKVYSISEKSSYSGHFQEQVRILEDNKLYLVRIVVNYNNERTLCYYRLMYTCDIFNSYYFDCDDYKDIVLQEAIEGTIKYGSEAKSIQDIYTTDQCLDSEGSAVDTFTEYEDQSKSKSYEIIRTYECTIDFNIKGETGFQGIDINIDSISKRGEITDTFSPENPKKVSISSDQIEMEASSLANINKAATHNVTLSGSRYIDKYEQTLKIPIQIDYNILSDIDVLYQLEPLDVSCGWLLVDGDSKWIAIYVTGTYVRSDSGMGVTQFGDDSRNYGTLSKYKDTYDELKGRMQNCDVLALRFRTHDEAKTGDQGNKSAWGQGSWYGGDRSSFDYNIYYDTDNPNSYNLILYVFNDSNGDLQLTTFGKNYTYSSPGTWYGQNIRVPSSPGDLKWVKAVKPFALSHNVSDEILAKPFSKYFKVEESSITVQKYRWSRIHYYQNFTWTNVFNVPLDITMSLQVNNGVTLQCIESIPNLTYINSGSYTLQVDVSNSESFDNWLDKILYISTSTSLVALPDENGFREVKPLQVSQRSIYDKYGNKVEYLKEDIGDSTKELSQLSNSKHKLQCIDGRLQLKKGVPNSRNILSVMGREEEQNIAISNIIQINE